MAVSASALFRLRKPMRAFWLAGFAMAPAVIPGDLAPVLIFVAFGAAMLLARPSLKVRLEPVYVAMAAVLALYSVALGLLNGNLLADLRWVTYPASYLLFVPLFASLGLLGDPLRLAVTGMRVGIVIASAVAVASFLVQGGRIGFGLNAATAAFILVACAVVSRIAVHHPHRFVPNSVGWFYLALVPIFLTGTRVVLPVFVVAAIIDLWRLKQDERWRSLGWHRQAAIVAFVGLITAAAAGILADAVFERLTVTRLELSALVAAAPYPLDGLAIRLTLWERSLAVIAANPLFGLGGVESMRAIKQGITENAATFAPFNHVHNVVLDELRMRGIVGLALLVTFFATVGSMIWRRVNDNCRITVVLFATLLVSYGSMHGLLQTERNLTLIAVFMVLLLRTVSLPIGRHYRRPPTQSG